VPLIIDLSQPKLRHLQCTHLVRPFPRIFLKCTLRHSQKSTVLFKYSVLLFWLIATIRLRYQFSGKSLQSKVRYCLKCTLLCKYSTFITDGSKLNLHRLQQMDIISKTWIFSTIHPMEAKIDPKSTLFYEQRTLIFDQSEQNLHSL